MRLTVQLFILSAVLALAAPVAAQTLRVTASATNLRAGPSADAAIVASLTQGEELDALEQVDSWFRARLRSTGQEGFVHGLVVEAVGVQTDAGAAPPMAAKTPAASAPGNRSGVSPGPSVPSPVERTYLIRPFAGLWSGTGTTGLGLGIGVAARPFSNDRLEVVVDIAYARQRVNRLMFGSVGASGEEIAGLGSRLFQGSGSLLYNFRLSSESFTPFAGLGLQYGNQAFVFTSEYSDADRSFIRQASAGFDGIGLQALVGLEKPVSDRWAWRAELRASQFGIMLLGGLSF